MQTIDCRNQGKHELLIQDTQNKHIIKYLCKLLGLIGHPPVQLGQSLVLVLSVIVEVIIVIVIATSATATSFLQNLH